MAALDLRPLSLGEVLDRTFSLYRQNFWLFVGICALPRLLILIFQLGQVAFLHASVAPLSPHSGPNFGGLGSGPALGGILAAGAVGAVIYVIAFLYAHGASVCAVSDLYLGRSATISGSFRKMRGHALNLFGVLVLEGLATLAGFILLFVPGFYVMCRVMAGVPAAILEDLGPSDSLQRSWTLTEENAGRAFVILLLSAAISYALVALFTGPFFFLMFWAALQKNVQMIQFWTMLIDMGSFIGGTLATPVLTISATIFYYDLRVRKEAFDLQMMMTEVQPAGDVPPAPGLASPLS
ncbi:MAG: hypothetical protein WA823_17035 [Candidatus Acidiferrales bacterium]